MILFLTVYVAIISITIAGALLVLQDSKKVKKSERYFAAMRQFKEISEVYSEFSEKKHIATGGGGKSTEPPHVANLNLFYYDENKPWNILKWKHLTFLIDKKSLKLEHSITIFRVENLNEEIIDL